MEYRVGVEDMEPDNWVAYVFDLPGCFSSARTQSGAAEGLPTAIKNYLDGRRAYIQSTESLPGEQSFSIKVAEVFISYPAKEYPEYLVNAMFENDLHPIDMNGTLLVLDWNRHDYSSSCLCQREVRIHLGVFSPCGDLLVFGMEADFVTFGIKEMGDEAKANVGGGQ